MQLIPAAYMANTDVTQCNQKAMNADKVGA